MADILTYRPSIEKVKLKKIAENLFKTKLNRFIDEAVKEKIAREAFQASEIEKLSLDIGKLLCERMGWKVYAPGPKLRKELDDEIKRIKSGKAKYSRLP